MSDHGKRLAELRLMKMAHEELMAFRKHHEAKRPEPKKTLDKPAIKSL